MGYRFGQFAPEHLHKMEEGVALFNQQKYWECHEALEEVWLEDRNDPARNVYWAVIQIAAVCIHYRNENLIGAQGMLSKAREKFKRCRDEEIITQLAYDYLDWAELENLVGAISEDAPRMEEFADLFHFRFKHYQRID
jgi:uncharacterized protein